jgi:excisionase family DNA binding protein
MSLTEAAERLNVHYMTAYKYVRTGRLHATKSGGQWVVSEEELEAFTGARGRDQHPQRAEVVPQLLEARLLVGDENGTFQLLENAQSAGASPEELYLDLLTPALVSIGERWHAGELSIADEHLATATAIRVVARFGPRFASRGRSRGTVIIAGVAGDHHSLPTALLRDLLRSRRFDVLDLGAHTPADSILDVAAGVDNLVAVGLSATNGDNEFRISETLHRLDDGLTVPVILGGSAIRDRSHARSLGPCIHSESARDALDKFELAHTAAAVSS